MTELKLDRHYTVEEYKQIDESVLDKSFEYLEGNLVEMSSGSILHGIISGNVSWSLRNGIKASGKECLVFNGNVKLAVNAANSYFIPDIMVVCGKYESDENIKDAILNPLLLIEILSQSTQDYDRGTKFYYYRQIPSLKEFIAIDQARASIDIYRKKSETNWEIQMVSGIERIAEIASLGISMPLSEIYAEVEWG